MSWRNADVESQRLGERETWRMRERGKGGHHDAESRIRFHGVTDTMQ